MIRTIFFTLALIFCFTINVFSVAFPVNLIAGGLSDGNGDPYVGYKLYAYYSGTSVELAVYTSRDQSIPLVQPITLDSRGAYQFFANGVYKLVLRNPDDDTTIITFDEQDFTKNAENTFSLSDAGGVVRTYFTGPDGLNYINSGNLGLGMTVPATALHIYKPSPAIRYADSTESIVLDAKFAGGYYEIKTVSGTTVESLLKIPAKLDEAPSGFLATPVGTIQMYAGTTAPSGWLLCQGQTLTDGGVGEKNKPLYDVIGTTYGGTGPADFKVPDMQGKYARGKDGSFALGATCNDTTAKPAGFAISNDTSPDHTHASGTLTAVSNGAHTHNYSLNASGTHSSGNSRAQGTPNAETGAVATTSSGAHTHTMTGSTAAGGSDTHNHGTTGWDTETRPNSVVVNYIIYAGTKY